MKLVVGLGNPGEKYKDTWHNVGFMVIDAIIKTLTVSPHIEKKLDSLIFYHHASQTVFARPQTFMNSSGVSVKKLLVHFKIKLPERTLSPGKYFIYLAFSGIYGQKGIDEPGIVGNFTLSDNDSGRGNGRRGYFSTLLTWEKQEND